mmetsp:Transcript_24334/g.56381  ORF Transcript_24334/g.56381 Transcript_24334/m.56381 type:complete len:131 (-) Transcript_24334:124-516(-)
MWFSSLHPDSGEVPCAPLTIGHCRRVQLRYQTWMLTAPPHCDGAPHRSSNNNPVERNGTTQCTWPQSTSTVSFPTASPRIDPATTKWNTVDGGVECFSSGACLPSQLRPAWTNQVEHNGFRHHPTCPMTV